MSDPKEPTAAETAGFDPAAAAFEGVQLIEASAGTGKTWNIAALVIRAIREGIPGAGDEPTFLSIDQILVVTFGEAATKELRDRIRKRLFDEMTVEPDADVRRRLEDAVRGFDEAAIYTIHGFCQRALQDNAFESGVLFDFELVPDSESLTLETADDFWWRTTQAEAVEVVDMLLDLQVTPERLVRLAERVPRVDGDVDLQPQLDREAVQEIRDRVSHYLQHARNEFVTLRSQWQQDESKVRQSGLPYPAICELSDWLEERSILPGPQIHKHLIEKQAQGPPLFNLIRNFHQAVLSNLQAAVEELRVVVLREWLEFRDVELARRKRRANALFFDDLLYQLDAALQGQGGDRLAARVRQQYPVALIDEFQDTDLVQFNIFERCYGGGEDGVCLFLIGDPKQSIYSFRRADIYSYLNAKKKARRIHTLLENHRSEPAMVRGVNALFSFRPNPFLERDIPFREITSCDKAGRLLIGGLERPALHIRYVDRAQVPAGRGNLIPKNRFGEFVARHTARRIANLLTLGQSGEAMITGVEDDSRRPVVPGDVAVLVRSHLQARTMQTELAQLGVASVLQSQGFVFDTPEAEILLQVLAGIDAPYDPGHFRAALLTPLFGFDGEALATLEADSGRFETWLHKLQNYRLLWSERGFTTMFTRLLHDEGVAARVLAVMQGERRMTNLLHLGEMLGQADLEHRGGPGGLVQWLADQANHSTHGSERELRLESDAHRVQIVTMHHAKGLQYGIVFVPFAWSVAQEAAREPVGFFFHDPGNNFRPTWDLGTPKTLQARNRNRRRQEALAEEVRLLYVAVTRARHACSVVWGPVNYADRSSLAYLLHGAGVDLSGLADDALRQTLTALENASEGAIAFGPLACRTALPYAPTQETGTDLQVMSRQRRPDRPWRISSFSALKGDRPHHDFHLPDHDDGGGERPEAATGFFTFPGGPHTGNLVHGIFENLSFNDPAGHAEAIADQVQRHGFDNVPDALAILGDLVRDVLDTPLLEDGFCLADLTNSRRLVELEFFFPLRLDDPAALQTFCQVPVPPRVAEGYMKGFIDLVFEHAGRFYVLDYKSNLLGIRAEEYAPEALADTMAESGYDLQYLIYTVALHRYLRQRLPDYDYDTHMGGILYLFVRAMPAAGVFHARPERDTILALERVLTGEST